MIALDTNVLVRALAGDDDRQSPLARDFLRSLTPESPGFVCLSVILEVAWVLEKSLKMSRTDMIALLDGMMAAPAFEIEDGESVGEAIESARAGGGFADSLIAATNQLYGITETVTFDRDAARRFGWRLLG